MRHNKKFNHLSRKANHRAAMLSNMACSLILHKRISTTLAKAKALRIYVELILTRAKEDNMNNRRLASVVTPVSFAPVSVSATLLRWRSSNS